MVSGNIYLHINQINGKVYVGQTIRDPKIRWGINGGNYSKKTKFGKAITKYGWSNFDHIILPIDCDNQKTLDYYENYYIELFNSFKNGYNSSLGGDDNPMRYEETRAKIKGRKHTQEELEKMIKNHNHPHKNYNKMSGETLLRAKERAKLLHTYCTKESYEKMKASRTGKNEDIQNPNSKKVLLFDTKTSCFKMFHSLSKLSKENNLGYSSVRLAFQKQRILYNRYFVFPISQIINKGKELEYCAN